MTEHNPEEKSKSQIKREHLALLSLSKRLVELSDKILLKLSLPESLMDAIKHAKTLNHGARKRQLRYIAGCMDLEDGKTIQKNLDSTLQPHRQEVQAFHEIEHWRDQLLSNDDSSLNDFLSQHPDADRQQLRQLIRNTEKEQAQNKSPKSARLLFKYLQTYLK